MKPHRIAFAAAVLALAACATQESPSSTDAPEGKRVAGSESVGPLQIFRAFGTEPFWNVNVEGNTLTYTTPEDQAGVVMQGERRSVEDGVEINGSDDGKSFALTVKAGTCSDGMSDKQYELTSRFRFGDIKYEGCAERLK